MNLGTGRKLTSKGRVVRATGLVAGSLVILAAVAVALTPVDPDPTEDGHGWLGTYYPDLLFLGEPMVRSEALLRFDWRRASPFPSGRPVDRFSARWQTCLALAAPASITFEVASDDGARVLVGGMEVVDDWGEHGARVRSGTRSLDAGVHRVEVEYYEMTRDARIDVVLRLPDGEKVPIEWQRIPPCTSPRAVIRT